MSKFSERSKKRKQELKEQNIEARNERLRLKALPKVLSRLETELGNYVDFMNVYDGYLGDFTGQIIPVEPVANPFVVIHEMNLNFPHPNSLNTVEKKMYITKIEAAFIRMGFELQVSGIFVDSEYKDFPAPPFVDLYISGIPNAAVSPLYELFLYHIMDSNIRNFDIFTSVNYKGVTLKVERYDNEYLY
ncbi:MAG: hypothetical protein JEZ09_06830 [Salinivirgaceae bacterium]|nr:hypothetical protein [Salinivirgaceae bacterium]